MSASSFNHSTSLEQVGHQARKRKISRVWCLAKDMGFTKDKDDGLYLIVESLTGKNSIAALDNIQLETVIRTLEKLKSKQNRKKRTIKKEGVEYLQTPAQRKLADDYMVKLTPVLRLAKPEAYKEAVCRRTFRKEYKKLNREQIQKFIEILKSILQRETNNAVLPDEQ